MDTDAPKPENKGPETVKVRKSGLYLVIAVVAVLVAGIIFLLARPSKPVVAEPEKPVPLFHRDEPTKPQILQPDYSEKVKEMIDSGKSVNEISKDTRLRKDEIRKIKKDNKKQKEIK